MEQYITLYDLGEVFQKIEQEAGSDFLDEVQAAMERAVEKTIGEKPRLMVRYSNDPSLAVGRRPDQSLPSGTFFLNVFALGDKPIEAGELYTADVRVFLVVNTETRSIDDQTANLVTIQ